MPPARPGVRRRCSRRPPSRVRRRTSSRSWIPAGPRLPPSSRPTLVTAVPGGGGEGVGSVLAAAAFWASVSSCATIPTTGGRPRSTRSMSVMTKSCSRRRERGVVRRQHQGTQPLVRHAPRWSPAWWRRCTAPTRRRLAGRSTSKLGDVGDVGRRVGGRKDRVRAADAGGPGPAAEEGRGWAIADGWSGGVAAMVRRSGGAAVGGGVVVVTGGRRWWAGPEHGDAGKRDPGAAGPDSVVDGGEARAGAGSSAVRITRVSGHQGDGCDQGGRARDGHAAEQDARARLRARHPGVLGTVLEPLYDLTEREARSSRCPDLASIPVVPGRRHRSEGRRRHQGESGRGTGVQDGREKAETDMRAPSARATRGGARPTRDGHCRHRRIGLLDGTSSEVRASRDEPRRASD